MTFTVHHLQRSQSERIVWLCEELGIPYELKIYKRDRATLLAPAELKALHPAGTAPLLTDGPVTLAESGAIVAYILAKYAPADTPLAPGPSAPHFADYLYWLHWANGTLQPSLTLPLVLQFSGLADEPVVRDNAVVGMLKGRLDRALGMMDERLKSTGAWLAGAEFTAADIMAAFSVTTGRLFCPLDLTPYEGIVAWMGRLSEREGYRRFIEKAEKGEDRGVVPTVMREAPEPMRRG